MQVIKANSNNLNSSAMNKLEGVLADLISFQPVMVAGLLFSSARRACHL